MNSPDPLPKPEKKTLLLIALSAEAGGFIPADAKPCWQNPDSPAESEDAPELHQQRAYRLSDTLTLGLSGPMGHSMVSVASRLLLDSQGSAPFERLVNFGAVGRYTWSSTTKTLKAYCVGASLRWDQVIPLRGFEFYGQAAELHVPQGKHGVCCLTGNRFTSNFEQLSRGALLQGDVEDNELYDVARWSQLVGLPLTSIKFVTNDATPDGVTEFVKNLAKAQLAGADLLRDFLASG